MYEVRNKLFRRNKQNITYNFILGKLFNLYSRLLTLVKHEVY